MKSGIGIDIILEGAIDKCRHVLFLYTSLVNKYAIQASFLASYRKGEHLLYITEKEPSTVVNQLNIGHELLVIHPGNIAGLENRDNLRMIIDGIESHEILDSLTGNENNIAMCMYDLSQVQGTKVRELIKGHNRLILNSPDMAVLSSGMFDRSGQNDETIDRLVRDYLDILILALLAGKPMCGTDIMDIVHRNFNVLLSPGTIYPLLHKLKKEGLLECDCNIKKKVYKPAKGSEAHIREILDGHLLANEFLNGFVKSNTSEG